jgi:hypothetical protein
MPQNIPDPDEWMKRQQAKTPEVKASGVAPDPDEWMRRQQSKTVSNVSAPTMDPDEWMRRQSKPRQRYAAPRGGDLLGQAERESRSAANMVGDLPARPTKLENATIGAERTYFNRLLPAASSIAEVTEGMKTGNFQPLWQATKEVARGTYNALTPPKPVVQRDASGNVSGMQLRPPEPTLQAAQQKREQRYQAGPDYRRAQVANERLNARAAADPTLTGKLIRGGSELLTSAAPVAIAGAAGGLPGVALASAAMSADNPGMATSQAAMNVLPAPGLGRLAGKLKGAPTREPLSTGRALGDAFNTGSQAMRTLKTAFDFSAPLSQGRHLTMAHPLQGARPHSVQTRCSRTGGCPNKCSYRLKPSPKSCSATKPLFTSVSSDR